MSDILKKDMSSVSSDLDWDNYKPPKLITTIISRYRCRRCKEEFSKTKSFEADPYNNASIKRMMLDVASYLGELSTNRYTQVHFCNHDSEVDGKFQSLDNVVEFLKYKIENGLSVEAGPADYLGSNIIKDKRSIDPADFEGVPYKGQKSLYDKTEEED